MGSRGDAPSLACRLQGFIICMRLTTASFVLRLIMITLKLLSFSDSAGSVGGIVFSYEWFFLADFIPRRRTATPTRVPRRQSLARACAIMCERTCARPRTR